MNYQKNLKNIKTNFQFKNIHINYIMNHNTNITHNTNMNHNTNIIFTEYINTSEYEDYIKNYHYISYNEWLNNEYYGQFVIIDN